MLRNLSLLPFALLIALLISSQGQAADPALRLATTTSTANSGLMDFLLPQFTAETGLEVHLIAVGTGKALRLGREGDVDIVLVHARQAEDKFVADGYGVDRADVMYNDFIIVGPPSDPAAIGGLRHVAAALKQIATAKALFASRGDNSGTYKKEVTLWQAAGIDQGKASGTWYRETGSGMGATLNVAVGMGAYALTDRGTWISFRNRGEFKVLVEGDDELFNQYGVILVDPARHPRVKAEEGQAFIDWILGEQGQRAIAGYRLGGQQLFFPNAKR